MKFTAIAIAAGLVAAPVAHMAAGDDGQTPTHSRAMPPQEDQVPWYEQAERLEEQKASHDAEQVAPDHERRVTMIRKAVVQDIPAPAPDGDAEESIRATALPAVDATEREISCLMSVAYHEARGEPREGKVAVIEVVLARRDSGRWPSTACGVVAQRSQFSFVRRGRIPDVPSSSEQGLRSLVLDVLSGRTSSSARGATFFHATYAKPSWRHRLRHVSQIGRHLFYTT